jgi:3-isopropylmalate dehydrogenase
MSRIAVIPGDGIGPEVAREGVATLEVVAQRFGLNLQFEWFDFGADRYLKDGTTLPQDAFVRLRDEFQAILFGAVGDPRVPSNIHAKDILLGLRTRLDLYINLRPCRLYDERLSPLKGKGIRDLQFTVFRENTEGLYVDVGGVFKQGTPDEVAVNEDVNTRKGVERIIRAAFDFARARGLRRVCMADKANVLTYGHGLWRRVFAEVAREYAGIEPTTMYVDALAMDLIRRPERYEVIVTNNMFGDILTDLGAALTGGLGLAASGNINPGRVSLFEPVHGSAPDIAGKGIANPLAMCLTGSLMLEHLGHGDAAKALEAAVAHVVREGPLPPDLGGKATSAEVGAAVRAAVQRR